MLELHPEGFEEEEGALVAYTDGAGEERLRSAFEEVSAESVEPGWGDRWREFHQPISIGRLWVGPPWEQPPPEVVGVTVDPGRAFGTGSHPTTGLCLAFLLDLEQGSLLDIGCGSGVLAVAAAKLGFDPVTAIDREPAALEAARRNAETNGVEIDVWSADVLGAELPPTDVALANIDLASVEAVSARLEARVLVTAGYFHNRRPDLPRFAHRERRIDGGWAADLFERQ
jgi:ribosomal protein L11 methyltransferase